jgi:hypothetical protein
MPELLRVAGEGKLRFGIVHDDNVTHAGESGASEAGLNHGNAQAGAGKFAGTGSTDDAGADNEDVIGARGHFRAAPWGATQINR